MRVICAWCQNEGRSGLLRIREPLDDRTDTHGICERHQQELFEAFPSSSFPSTRWLFVVPGDDPRGFAHLAKILGNVPGATVIMDRRRGERRQTEGKSAEDRRRLDRRVRRPEASSLGYRLIRFTVRESATPSVVRTEATETTPPAGGTSDRGAPEGSSQ
jgi:hypothetical protein